jgi:hypothetical protein
LEPSPDLSLLLVLKFMADLSIIDWCVCAAYLALVFGLIVAVILPAVSRIEGGWSAFWTIAAEHDKFQMFHLNPKLFSLKNFTGKNTVFTAAAYFLKNWVTEGPTHHFALGAGHHARTIQQIAEIFDLESVTVTPEDK